MGEAKKKQIECPVVGRRIKPAECGENRCSTYDCPADCPHNPWGPANYGRALELNDRYTEKMLSRLRAEQTARYGYPQSPPLREDADTFELLHWFSGQFFRERDAEGRTLKERWEAEHYRGLNNDLRIMIEAESRMVPAVLEIRQVLDEDSVLAVDLLATDDEPFLIVDRSLAARACRFSTLFAVIYRLPHYVRVHSAAIPLPEVSGMGMQQVFAEISTHLGAPQELPALRAWLMENVCRVADAIKAVGQARLNALFRSMDAGFTKSVYELRGTAKEFCALIEAQEDMEAGGEPEDGFESEWVCLGEDNPFGTGRILIGRILLHADGYVQLEASSSRRSEQLKQRVEELCGGLLAFSRERTDDLGAQIADKRSDDFDATLVPPGLLENTMQAETAVSRVDSAEAGADPEQFMREQYMENFLDSEVPALDGMTPRQAAEDPAMRPKLIELMKAHIRSHDEENLVTGSESDINWMLDELGLDEINFLPPPPRERLVEEDEDEFDDEYELPASPLFDEELINERIQELDAEYDPDYLITCFETGFPPARDMLDKMCAELKIEPLRRKLAELAAKVCFLMLKPLPEPVDVFTEELLNEQLAFSIEYVTEDDIEGLVQSLEQPLMARMIVKNLLEILPEGEDSPVYGNCFLYMTALSESLNILFVQAMQLVGGEQEASRWSMR